MIAVQSAVSSSFPHDAAWNQWREPNRDGVWHGALPRTLSTLKLVWEKPLQPSYSGPICNGELVFTTETVDQVFERMTAYDLKTGELAWSAKWDGAITVPPYAMANGSWIKSTPALGEGSLLVLGMRDEVICLEAATGQIRWQADLADRFGTCRAKKAPCRGGSL